MPVWLPSRSTRCSCAASMTARRPTCCDGAWQHDYELRFIEQMPLDAQHGWNREAMVTADETLTLLQEHFALTPLDGRGSAPAEKFLIDGGPHTVGIIGSVTRPFCGDCNRVRLTADGQILNCLFAREESDLRSALRGGAIRSGDRRALGRRDDDQAAGPWHRRSELPAVSSSDVVDRRLELLRRLPEASGVEESPQRLLVVVTGKPDLAALGRVDLGVVPQHLVRRVVPTALGRADKPFSHRAGTVAAPRWPSRDRTPTAHRPSCARRHWPGSPRCRGAAVPRQSTPTAANRRR